MAAKKHFVLFCKTRHVTKICKTTFPKELFNKIWIKVEEHEYIYISFWNKIWKKKYSVLKMAAKTSFEILRNKAYYAN